MDAMADIPIVRRFSRGDRLPVQAQRIWLILCGQVMLKKEVITYGDLAKLMGYADGRAGLTLARQLGIVGIFCKLNGLPPLNAIVVNAATKMPGHDVVLRDGRNVQQEMKSVMNEDWFAIRVPTTGTFRKVWDKL